MAGKGNGTVQRTIPGRSEGVLQGEIDDNTLFQLREKSINNIDSDYFKAIENNDLEKAQRIIDQQAAYNGYVSVEDYKDAHSAPASQYDKKDFKNIDLLREGTLEDSNDTNLYVLAFGVSNQPDDYFSPQGARWYGYNDTEGYQSSSAIKSAMRSIQSQMNEFGEVKEMPNITVYRAVPKSIKEKSIRNSDWVTPSLLYAKKHGKHRLGYNEYRIIKEDIPATDLWWDGNDINGWGVDNGDNYAYKNTKNNKKLLDVIVRDDNGNIIPPSKRFNPLVNDIRFQINQQNAPSTTSEVTALTEQLLKTELAKEVKMVSEQELMDLRDAQRHAVYHGSPHAFDKFSLDKIGTGEGQQAYGWGLYFTDKKSIVERYRDWETDRKSVV